LERLVKKYERGVIAPKEWLDAKTFQAMKNIRMVEQTKEIEKQNKLTLLLDLPDFEHPVFFFEKVCEVL
jgi:hypothetical protein